MNRKTLAKFASKSLLFLRGSIIAGNVDSNIVFCLIHLDLFVEHAALTTGMYQDTVIRK
jgi:hypothetical protein